jgi:hypothetical protein
MIELGTIVKKILNRLTLRNSEINTIVNIIKKQSDIK